VPGTQPFPGTQPVPGTQPFPSTPTVPSASSDPSAININLPPGAAPVPDATLNTLSQLLGGPVVVNGAPQSPQLPAQTPQMPSVPTTPYTYNPAIVPAPSPASPMQLILFGAQLFTTLQQQPR
jgi:hypothetical protein